jgi:dethiobiotin synthetase
VGKTLVTATLLHVLAGLGRRAVGMKPVAAGADWLEGQWVNEDVALLRAHNKVDAPLSLLNPYLFREPIAPHIAAERKGVRIEIPRIVAAFGGLSALAEVVLVEGAGGFRVPLDEEQDTADLAVALGLPVLLVVGMRLGCLNHALLTVEAITTRGLFMAGWVANRIDQDMAAYDENLATLSQRLPAPCLAEIPPLRPPTPESAARFVSIKRVGELLFPGP